jgi:hypothetical protein
MELDGRRARCAAMELAPRAWLRQSLDDLDMLTAARDRP